MANSTFASPAAPGRVPVIPWVGQWVPVTDIHIDEAYQRREQTAIVSRLVQRFTADLAFPLRVSRRADGSLWVKDGQHRLQAARACGYDAVYCHIEDSDEAAEAQAFVGLNSGTKAQSLLRFKAALIAGDDPDVREVADIITASGFVVNYDGYARDPQEFRAVQTALTLYRTPAADGTPGPDRLTRVLTLARATWPDKGGSGQSVIVRALDALFGNERAGLLNLPRFIYKVAPLDPAEVAITAHQRSRAHGHAASNWALRDMIAAYNAGLRDPARRLADPLFEDRPTAGAADVLADDEDGNDEESVQ